MEFPEKYQKGFYRVRRAWEVEDSQLAKFRIRDKAIECAKENPGYYVFSNEGELVYPTEQDPQILYGKMATMANIRALPGTDAPVCGSYRESKIISVLEVCDSWYRVLCEKAASGVGYINQKYVYTGTRLYTVQGGDTLKSIAENLLGNKNKVTEIMAANGLVTDTVPVGTQLVIA